MEFEKMLEDIQNKFIFNFQDIMVDEFEQFHSVKNNADTAHFKPQKI